VFGPVLDIHRRLFAGTPGRWAVELTTAWTLVLLATGMWLWVPRTWRKVTGVWVPRVRGRQYAVLRDWHTVVGLYLVPAVALIAFTGLLYGVGSKRLWDAATGGAASPPFKSFLRSPPSTVPSAAVPTVSVDVPVAMARERWPDSPLKVLFPRKPTDPYELTALGGSGPLSVGVLGLDRYTGTVLADNHYAALPWYERARMWALPIHQGTVYGTATKVLAVLACIGLAGLAVSGVWLWLDRRRPGRSGFPRAATGAVPMAGVVAVLVVAVLLPSVGASLMVVLDGEWLVGRIARQPVKSSKELSS